jgi:exopolyphosphatase/guanosine-5'-triphosphate,3'-diphosphate pyrophosphatase
MPSTSSPNASATLAQAARRAVIDIGTNSVKLLVAEVSAGVVRPLDERSETTRLGRGFYEDYRIHPPALGDTVHVVAQFAELAKTFGVLQPRVIATSAVREAKNRDELLAAIRQACALEVEVISGATEADLAFRGVTSDPRFAGHSLLILDVGGGSSEFILGQDQSQFFRDSFQLGVVRLMEQFDPGDPPSAHDLHRTREWLRGFVHSQIRPPLEPALHKLTGPPVLVGTGGTSTILSRMEQQLDDYDRERIESCRLTRGQVRAWNDRLWGQSLAERKRIVGLPAQRADVIIMGTAIFEAVMEEFCLEALRPSTRGLRFAAVLESE